MQLPDTNQRVNIYNSGHLVFLYDETYREAINQANPDILSGFAGDSDLADPALRSLAEQGILVIYELQQDDPIIVEVAVGSPLSEATQMTLPWMAPQTARITLPSGKLCIETYDSLQLGLEAPTDPGAVLDLPVGEYLLTLYRIDWQKLEATGREEYEGPYESIILTPSSEVAPLPEMTAFLRYPV